MAAVVELFGAWRWDCPACGRRNQAEMVTAELTPDELVDMARASGAIEPWQTELPTGEEFFVAGEFVTAPADVTCAGCGREFATRVPGQADGGSED